MKVAFLGATRGMGRELARLMVERGDALCVLGRSTDRLAQTRKDLELRADAAEVHTAPCDLLDRARFGAALDAARTKLGGLDCVVVTAGAFATTAVLEQDVETRDALLQTNFTNTIHFCEEARRRLLERASPAHPARLVVFSSVAGERARKPVRIYGAAKAGLSHYLDGLDHNDRGRGLYTIAVRPGFVRTEMTAELEAPPFAGDPTEVARQVLRAIDRGTPVVYAPPIWRFVMMAIRALPRFVMRRIDF